MKSTQLGCVAACILLSCSFHFTALAQTDSSIDPLETVQLVPPGEEPLIGTYYRMSDMITEPGESLFASPPYPGLPPGTSGFQVYAVDSTLGVYIVDDSALAGSALSSAQVSAEIVRARILNLVQSVQSAAADRELSLSASMMSADSLDGEMMTMESGEGSSFAEMYSSDDLWLEMISKTNTWGNFVIHPPAAESGTGVYDLFMTTNLSDNVPGLNVTNWIWLLRTSPGQTNVSYSPLTDEVCFFRLGRTNDDDGDGLSSAFEKLCSHTDPSNWDENTNGIPDGWEWDNFGSLQPGGADYDSDGYSNYYEYLHSTDPNTIAFTLSATNQYLSGNPVGLTLSVTKGLPAGMAVIIDGTNYSSASWTAYGSSNLQVNVGAEGWHSIEVGLRGRLSSSQQNWQATRVEVDSTPPVINVTNPASGVVSQSLIQLKGYCSENLASLQYDLTNANGKLSNCVVMISKRDFDTNTMDFTTNHFQAYDVGFSPGLNVLTLRATDMAGNVATTNLEFILDYSSDSNAPVVAVDWPQDGMVVSGGNVYCRGQINDPTGSLAVQLNGTNVGYSHIDRDGKFFMENVPLVTGINSLTFIATDEAGNSNSILISVEKSDVVFTIETAALGQPASGYLSDSNYTVWVNGVEVTNYQNGSWYCSNPNLTLDNATVEAVAIPNSSGQQLAMRSESASSASSSSSSSMNTGKKLSRPDGSVFVRMFQLKEQELFSDFSYYWPEDFRYDIHWEETAGGTGEEKRTWTPDHPYASSYDYVMNWPGGRWPVLSAGTLVLLPDGESEPYPAPVKFDTQGATLIGSTIYRHSQGNVKYDIQGQIECTLVTGGEPGANGKELYRITGNAHAEYFTDETMTSGTGSNVPPERVSIGSLGKLNSRGVLYAALPMQSEITVTPKPSGVPLYAAGVSAQPYKARLFFGGQDVTDTNVTVMVGQKISLSCSFPGQLPADFPTNFTYDWTIPGYAISNYVADLNSAKVYETFPTTNSSVGFYWVNGGKKDVQCKVTVNGEEIPLKTTFTVIRPEVTWKLTPKDRVAVDTNIDEDFPGYYYLRTGKERTTNDVGMLYEFKATDNYDYGYNWAFRFIQVATIDWKQNVEPATNAWKRYINMRGVDSEKVNSYQYYYKLWAARSGTADDTPCTALLGTEAFVWRKDEFECFLMFQPDGGIPVPLKVANWNWYGRASLVNPNTDPPTYVGVTPYIDPQPAVGVETMNFPIWTNALKNRTWTYEPGWYSTP